MYEPPDTETIFEDHVWPMYVTFYKQLKNSNVALVEFDGSSSKESILDAAVREVHSLFTASYIIDDIRLEMSKIRN